MDFYILLISFFYEKIRILKYKFQVIAPYSS
jgi:hypothetical protein